MKNYLNEKVKNIIAQSSESEEFFTEGCKKEGCCSNEGCKNEYCDDNTNDPYYNDITDDISDDDYYDDTFDCYDDEEIEDCDESVIEIRYEAASIPVIEYNGEYYIEYAMLERYMETNNIDSVSEAVSDICNCNKLHKSDVTVLVEAAKNKRKVSKGKSMKITLSQSKLADAINRGIVVKKAKRRKRK